MSLTLTQQIKAGFSAKNILTSVGPDGQMAYTYVLRYPRLFHSEVMTHREFNRCCASSRAIPTAKFIEQVMKDPAGPIDWGTNKPGMQAGAEIEQIHQAEATWLMASQMAVAMAKDLMALGLHKQVVNRVLEPYQWMTMTVTTASWDHFLHLRNHPDADPGIKWLAELIELEMLRVTTEGDAQHLSPDEWHLPFITPGDWTALLAIIGQRSGSYRNDQYEMAKVSAARCARTSYLNHDGTAPDVAKDLALYDRLAGSEPIHASPLEHQLEPDTPARRKDEFGQDVFDNPHLAGNMRGWVQFRKLHPNEYKR